MNKKITLKFDMSRESLSRALTVNVAAVDTVGQRLDFLLRSSSQSQDFLGIVTPLNWVVFLAYPLIMG